MDIILLKTISLILPSVHIFKSLVLMLTVFLKRGGVNFDYLPQRGESEKFKEGCGNMLEGQVLLKRRG